MVKGIIIDGMSSSSSSNNNNRMVMLDDDGGIITACQNNYITNSSSSSGDSRILDQLPLMQLLMLLHAKGDFPIITIAGAIL